MCVCVCVEHVGFVCARWRWLYWCFKFTLCNNDVLLLLLLLATALTCCDPHLSLRVCVCVCEKCENDDREGGVSCTRMYV